MPYTWDQKIARAQKLSQNQPTARELLELYIKIANFQKNISHDLTGTEHPDIRFLVYFLPQLHTLVQSLGSVPLQDALSDLGDDQERWSELLLKHWEQDGQTPEPAQAFLAYVLLQPYAQHVTSRMNVAAAPGTAQCPACGNPPNLSLLREFNNGAKRSLQCSLCSTEWEFHRVRCPYCGEEHKDRLPVFTAEEIQQVRIEGCDTCKSYIKCIDLSKDGYAVPPADDLATVALDLWAQEQGYKRPCPNMFLMETTELP